MILILVFFSSSSLSEPNQVQKLSLSTFHKVKSVCFTFKFLYFCEESGVFLFNVS